MAFSQFADASYMLSAKQEARIPKFWRIKGEGLSEPFETFVPAGSLTETEIIVMLQRLVCAHLDAHEIVSASLRKKARGYAPHLAPLIDRKSLVGTISIGSNPFYVASVCERDGV